MTLAKMSDFPGLTRQEQETPTKEYRGFSIERDPKDEHLYYVIHKDTGYRLPGRFLSKRAIEAEINAYIHTTDFKKRLADIEYDRTNHQA